MTLISEAEAKKRKRVRPRETRVCKIDLNSPDLLEMLADLEHEQWMAWSQAMEQKVLLPLKMRKRWQGLWKPYSELSEEEKKHDRNWARRVLKVFSDWWWEQH